MEAGGLIIGEGEKPRPHNFTNSEGVTGIKRDAGHEAYARCEVNSGKPAHAGSETVSGSQAANGDEDTGNEECHSPAIESLSRLTALSG